MTIYIVSSDQMPPKGGSLNPPVVNSPTQLGLTGIAPPNDGAGLKDFPLERSTDGVNFALIATPLTLAYNDTVLQGQPYYYRARARDSILQTGPVSNTVVAATSPSAAVITASSPTQNSIQWQLVTPSTIPQESVVSYRILQNTSGPNGTFTQVTSIAPNAFPYTFGGESAGTTYYVAVQAVSTSGLLSPLSNVVQVTTQAATAKTFPRNAAHLIGAYPQSYIDTQWGSKFATARMVYMQTWSGWRDGVFGVNFGSMVATFKSRFPNCVVLVYQNPGEIQKSLETSPSVVYDMYQEIRNNNRFAYPNGLTEATPGESWFQYTPAPAKYWKLNYTTAAPVRGGKNWMQWFIDRMISVIKLGQSTAASATTSNTNGGVTTQVDGFYVDNVFPAERPNTVVSGGTFLDYNRDGVAEDTSTSAAWTLIRNSYRAMFDYIRSAWPAGQATPITAANMGDWEIPDRFPATYGTLVGGPYDQMVSGGYLEALIGPSNALENFSDFASVMAKIARCKALSLPPQNVCVSGYPTSATDYQNGRYQAGVATIADADIHLAVNGSYNIANWMVLDEFNFDLGVALEAVPTSAWSQAGSNGAGVWKREFANGVVLVGARRGSGSAASQATAYGAVTLPFDVWRLRGTQSPGVNDASKIPAGIGIVLSPRTALFLSKSAT